MADKMKATHYLVPRYEEGVAIDLDYGVVAETIDDAEDWFVDAKDSMLDINKWAAKLAPRLEVHLADHSGKRVNRSVHKGDLVCLCDGENNKEWVVVEALEYDDYPDEASETFAIRLHAVTGLGMPAVQGAIHDAGSATLVIERNGAEIAALYHWRDEAGGNHSLWTTINEEQWLMIIRSFIEDNA